MNQSQAGSYIKVKKKKEKLKKKLCSLNLEKPKI
jgi:hypothetical protein